MNNNRILALFVLLVVASCASAEQRTNEEDNKSTRLLRGGTTATKQQGSRMLQYSQYCRDNCQSVPDDLWTSCLDNCEANRAAATPAPAPTPTISYVKKYTDKWPHCDNIDCPWANQQATMEERCSQHDNCSGFSYSSDLGWGCLKICGNNEGYNGYGSGTHDYWEKRIN